MTTASKPQMLEIYRFQILKEKFQKLTSISNTYNDQILVNQEKNKSKRFLKLQKCPPQFDHALLQIKIKNQISRC